TLGPIPVQPQHQAWPRSLTSYSHTSHPMYLDRTRTFSMLTVQIESDPYVGMLYVGHIHSGVLRVGDVLCSLDAEEGG
ncbi:hypothetical protein C0989_006064, partial [Termitomyces sp. Mn162]